MQQMNIGRLADLAGVNVDTVRYYERRQLLPAPARSPSGYRIYSDRDLERLQFVRRAKELGFSLAEIRDLLSLTRKLDSDMKGVKDKAQQRLVQIERKIAELQRVKRGLKQLVEACPGHGEQRTCPIVAALSGQDPLPRSGR